MAAAAAAQERVADLAMPASAASQQLVAKQPSKRRTDRYPQYEEIEGSQERSPYVVRHMQVQRQNWIQVEDSKANLEK